MSTTVTYKGQTLTTVENQTKTLTTGGTWMEGDLTLTDVSGGGGGDDFPLHDGDSHVWMDLDQDYIDYIGDVQIWFYQNKSNGVEITWGDGSPVETVAGSGEKSPTHTYASAGSYRIDLHVVDGTMNFGHSTETIVGRFLASSTKTYALNACVKYCETGADVTGIIAGAQAGVKRFDCSQSVLITGGFPSFQNCHDLMELILPPNITIQGGMYNLQNLYSLRELTIPVGVTQVPQRLEGTNSLMRLILLPTTPPTLDGARLQTKTGMQIIVPYSEDHSILTAYQNATNWSTYASYMVEAEA